VLFSHAECRKKWNIFQKVAWWLNLRKLAEVNALQVKKKNEIISFCIYSIYKKYFTNLTQTSFFINPRRCQSSTAALKLLDNLLHEWQTNSPTGYEILQGMQTFQPSYTFPKILKLQMVKHFVWHLKNNCKLSVQICSFCSYAKVELNLVPVTWSIWENYYSPLDGTLVHHSPSIMSPVPIYTPGWRETMSGKVSCLRKQQDGRDFKRFFEVNTVK